ncbi:MAG: ABC transporter permease [Chloroflexi bacterium]|nr:ABC transporter permease [Chloroflexota bacterium]
MKRYLVSRLLTAALSLVGVSLIIFAVMQVLPGDVARAILVGTSGEGSATPEKIAALRKELGLDQPVHIQYLNWAWGLLRLDVGRSLTTGFPVFEEVKNRLPLTLELAALTVLFGTLLSIPMGVVSAIRQNTWLDHLMRVIAVAGIAMPIFWTGTLIILVLAVSFKWLPPLGYVPPWQDPWTNFQQMVWPALALGYYHTAVIARMTRSQMLEVLRQDYVRTAWAKGLREQVVVTRHALRNALLPVVTLISIQFAFSVGGTVIMETLFFLPGIGKALVDAISFKDFPMVQTIIVVFAAMVLIINLLTDLLYAALDPRITLG